MLLDFKIKNYKSFYNLTDISMIADSAKKDLNDRLINVGNKNLKKMMKKMKKHVIIK